MSSSCSSIGCSCSILQHMHALWHTTGRRLLWIVYFLRISSRCLAWCTRMKRCCKLSWIWTTFYLGKCTMVHLVSFLHDLYNIRLSATNTTLQLLWSFAWCWRNYHLVEVRWIVLVLKSLHCWVLLARDAALLLLSNLWLKTNCWSVRSSWTFKELLIHRVAVSIWSINWIHWV